MATDKALFTLIQSERTADLMLTKNSWSWLLAAVSAAVARLLWWTYKLQISLQIAAINEIATPSSPGG